jgi:hypothetical protein
LQGKKGFQRGEGFDRLVSPPEKVGAGGSTTEGVWARGETPKLTSRERNLLNM